MEHDAADQVDEGILLCAECFQDRGLRNMARWIEADEAACPNCGIVTKSGLSREQLLWLSNRFFEKGSTIATEYGGAPAIVFNDRQTGSLTPNPPLAADVGLLERTLGIGFFHYGPRLWMLGSITPLEHLQDERLRAGVIATILESYPKLVLTDEEFYRVRKAPKVASDPGEYDAPPEGCYGSGRLDAPGFPVLYGSQDAEICVHESRFVAGDDLYIGTLRPTRALRV